MPVPPGSVQAVTRALDLLRILGSAGEGMRLSDLAAQAGLAVSTTHRLLTTMENSGFVQSDQAQGEWHVGREAFAVGAAFVNRRNFVAPALTYLRRLRDSSRETANLGVLDSGQLVTVSQVESREIMRAISPPGGRVPATCSAMGKAIMATWPDDQITAFCDLHGFSPLTSRSHTSLDGLLKDIGNIRRLGYAVDDEEHVRGLRCVAAAIWSADGEAVGAISLSGIATRIGPEKIETAARQVVSAALQLSEAIGGRPGPAPDSAAP